MLTVEETCRPKNFADTRSRGFRVFLARPLTLWMFVEDGLLLTAALVFGRGLRPDRERNDLNAGSCRRLLHRARQPAVCGLANRKGQATGEPQDVPRESESC